MNGYIKYNRMLLDSTTFHREAPYIALFTYILLNVQYKDTYRNRTTAGQLERDTDWRKDAEYMGVKLYLLLAVNYETGKLNINKIKFKTESLWKILRKLERENFIIISKDKTLIALVDTESCEANIKPLQNRCNSEVEPPQDDGNSAVTAYNDIKKKEFKKEEGRSESDSHELAEKLSKVFVCRNFSQRDNIETLSKHISKLLKRGAKSEQIAESIDWFSRNRFDPIFNGYTFRDNFYDLLKVAQEAKLEAERKKQARITEEEKRRLEEEKHERGHKALREATAKDKFYFVRTAAKYPKIALMSLKNMIADGRATIEEANMLIKELNLQAV